MKRIFITAVLFCRAVFATDVTAAFDFGTLSGYMIDGDTVVFELTDKKQPLCCLIRNAPEKLRLQFRFAEDTIKRFETQGVYISADGLNYKPVELTGAGELLMQADVQSVEGSLFVSTSIPNGRNRIEQLLIDTAGTGNWKMLHKDGRSVAMFELGNDDGKKPVHYIWAEDTYETAGALTVEYMIRTLSANPDLARKLGEQAVLRIMPVISLYSQAAGNSSYTDLTGKSAYGGGSWSKNPLPPELSLVHDMVVRTIDEKRLGFLLTVHSWYSQNPYSGIETIRTAGENSLSPERADWALDMMNTVMNGVSDVNIKLSEKAWFGGLFRHLSLADCNAMTFRIEIGTQGHDLNDYADIAEKMITNLTTIDDWSPVLGLKK